VRLPDYNLLTFFFIINFVLTMKKAEKL